VSRLLTPQEVSALTRLKIKTVYAKCCRREIPYIKLGGKLLFDEESIMAWVDSHRVEPLAAAAR
jgi:excisionase family DNA binding protein